MRESSLQVKALSKNNFYQSTYRILLLSLIGTGLLAFALLSLVSYYIIFPSKAQYFIVKQNKQEEKMLALDYPIVSRNEILRWSGQSVISIYNFDFSNWEVRLKEVAPLFTASGFSRFQDALKLDGALSGIIEQKLQVTAVVTGPPVIIAEGILAGRYTWKVSMPVLLTYTSSSESRQRKIVVTLVITRVSVNYSPRGYAIEQYYEDTV